MSSLSTSNRAKAFVALTLLFFAPSSCFTPSISAQRQAFNTFCNAPRDTELSDLKSRELSLRDELRRVQSQKATLLQQKKLRICIIGFGNFGQFLAKTFSKNHDVTGASRGDYKEHAAAIGCDFCHLSEISSHTAKNGGFDVIVIAVAIPAFVRTIQSLPDTVFKSALIVDVLSVKEHPREAMMQLLPDDSDILCTHPMFGPESGRYSWTDLAFVYERTRVLENSRIEDVSGVNGETGKRQERYCRVDRVERFLSIFEQEGCRMIEMTCKEHDAYAANSQFISHLLGRILRQQGLVATPIDTKAFTNVLQLVETTCNDSWDLFYGLYKYNQNSASTLLLLRKALVDVEWRLREMENMESSGRTNSMTETPPKARNSSVGVP